MICDLPTAMKIMRGEWIPTVTTTSTTTSTMESHMHQKHSTGPRSNAQLNILRARAIPNQHIGSIFSINNSFTTTDETFHAEFRRLAAQRIKFDKEGWREIVHITEEEFSATWKYQQVVGSSTGHGCTSITAEHDPAVSLVNLVQGTVLGLILRIIFPGQTSNKNDGLSEHDRRKEIFHAAKYINTLWLASKRRNPGVIERLRNIYTFRRLRAGLEKLIPGNVLNGIPIKDNNPLSMILPAYETMWRVALLCLVEVNFQRGLDTREAEDAAGIRLKQKKEESKYENIFDGFLRNPTKEEFNRVHTICTTSTTPDHDHSGTRIDQSISCADIINETLRLYPPTKRIYRSLPPSRSFGKSKLGEGGTVAIDVEYLHRSTAIWGDDALLFKPSRWRKIADVDVDSNSNSNPNPSRQGLAGTIDIKRAFMPFGAGKSLCPAQAEFGPMVVAVVVGVLAREVDKMGYYCERVNGCSSNSKLGVNGEDEGPLKNGRTGFEGVYLLPRPK
ncbi:hypothetical protein DFH27DRAFT_528201 [Peziza echinospora]|nr:hypothetical protein DFH27DRAFT_528201 [Peziza echinospora]